MEKIFYNASLPRSGSTLLQNILAQNPSIHATPTSGLFDLIQTSKEVFTDRPDFAAQDSEIMNKAFGGYCKGAIDGFCSSLTDKDYVIDKSFDWASQFNLLATIYGEKPKMIIAVRDLREVYASMEQGYRNMIYKSNRNVDWKNLKATTLHKRVVDWSMTHPLGTSLDKLIEVINWKNDKDVCFIKYEHLCKFPDNVMAGVYSYLSIPFYQHDFNNVVQVTDQNDGYYTFNHKIDKVVKEVKPKALDILGKDICNIIYEQNEWFFKYFNYAL